MEEARLRDATHQQPDPGGGHDLIAHPFPCRASRVEYREEPEADQQERPRKHAGPSVLSRELNSRLSAESKRRDGERSREYLDT